MEKHLKDLKFDDKNFNKHTEYGMSLIEKSLRQNGAGRSILLDKDDRIIAGNGIVEAAGQVGLENVRVIETDGNEIIAVKRTDLSLDSKKGREMALADNATSAADLEWDEELLKSEFDDDELKGWGVDADWPTDENDVVEDEVPEVNESEPAESQLGGVYQLGEHRLMCGDSTDAGSVAILMDGQKADMVFTDPPYNIKMKRSASILNDNLDDTSYMTLLDNAVKCAAKVCKGNQYWWIGWKEYPKLEKILEENKLPITNCIVWVKPSIGLGKVGYRYRHELCLFCGEIESKSESDVWDFDRDTKGLHPTMKPIQLVSKAIKDSQGSSVLDLFGGSGSTLIACEQLGRKCYMMELDPHYCDVIRKRYWKFKTGSEDGWQEGTAAVQASRQFDSSECA